MYSSEAEKPNLRRNSDIGNENAAVVERYAQEKTRGFIKRWWKFFTSCPYKRKTSKLRKKDRLSKIYF
jgi:hypothetical protein